MKTLFLLRHAKSSWNAPQLDDFQRPLAPRGENALPGMAQVLDAIETKPERVYSSPAKRALQTAQGIVQLLSSPIQVETHDPLYLADVNACLELTHSLPDQLQSVMLVGHIPGMEEFLEWLCCGQSVGFISLKTANLAWLELNISSWKDTGHARASLRALIPSRMIKSLL